MYNLEEIHEKISLVALAEEAGAKFDNPHRLISRCPLPWHAGDRSSKAFTIFDNGWKWKCHSSCPPNANGGDIFAFYMAWKDVNFKMAVAELSERVGSQPTTASFPKAEKAVIPTAPAAPQLIWRTRAEQFIVWAESNLSRHPEAQKYLEKERGLSPETWRAFRVGYNPANLYDDPARWGLDGKKIWLPRGLVIPGFWQGRPWYIKVRRPLPEQAIGQYLGEWSQQDGLPDVKFGGPRGGVSTLFRLELSSYKPVLILPEGEWDTMLAWEHCPALCDAATLGGASAKLDTLDLTLLTRYPAIIAIYDADPAGEKGREYLARLQKHCPRLQIAEPPAHDLTNFWKSGGNLRAWLATLVAQALTPALTAGVPEDWRRIAWLAEQDACNEEK
jgi:hypothetical protein